MISRPCPICQSLYSVLLFKNELAPIQNLDMSYEVHRCKKCEFHFAGKLPPDSHYQQYYRELSKYDVASDISFLDQARIREAVKFLAERTPLDRKVIDAGCGNGAFLAALRDAGWTSLIGLDPAPKSAIRARENFGLEEVHTGTLAEIGKIIDLREVDVVCLMAVLEHLPNFFSDLQLLLRELRIGARLFVEVPAVEGFSAENGEPFGEFSLEHIQYFSSASVHNLFNRLGLQIIGEHYQPLPTIDSASLFVLAEKYSDVTEPPDCLQLALEPSAAFDRYIQSSKKMMQAAVDLLPTEEFLVYGAGSHSARLVPSLDGEVRERIVGIVDSNLNLIGKSFDRWVIRAPEWLRLFPTTPLVISSFRSQREIYNALSQFVQNPLVTLY